MTAQTWRVVAPSNPGDYARRFGWRVVDANGYTGYSGDEQCARQIAKDLNKRAARDARKETDR